MIDKNGRQPAAQPELSALSTEQPSGAELPQVRSVPLVITAGLLVIGNEILSGRTKDKNIGHIARVLTEIGVDLKEVRVVADEEPAIVAALNELRTRYSYVFTTGGIGPTHDDITSECVARAFGVPPSTIHTSGLPSFTISMWIQAWGFTHSSFTTLPCSRIGAFGSNSAPKA